MRQIISCIISIILLLWLSPIYDTSKCGEMKAGFAERDITPDEGMERPGAYTKNYHKGKPHDPCKVRAVVFDDGLMRAALVGVDVCYIPRPVVEEARKKIQKRCNISPKAILIGASHTHSGGPTGKVLPGEYDKGSELVKHLAYNISQCADADYLDSLCNAIVEAVTDADRGRVNVHACVGSGYEGKVAFNRRFRMKNGLSYSHPRYGNPDIIEPAGPIDPEVGVIGVWDDSNRFLGCVVNYSCHGTTGPGGTSADWIYYLEQTIRGVMGNETIVVFLNGACGDITQVNNLNPYNIDRGERSARFVGRSVGAEVLKVLVTAEPGRLIPIAAETEILRIPRRKPSRERVEKSIKLVSSEKQMTTEWIFAKEIVMLDYIIRHEPIAEFEVQAIQIGPAVFLSNPAEFFCQLGLDIKSKSQFPFTYIVTLANGAIGYVPTEEALGPNGGGYETRLTSYSNLEVKAGTKIVQACLGLAKALKPGSIPEPPLVKPFKEPWKYGNVPPELK